MKNIVCYINSNISIIAITLYKYRLYQAKMFSFLRFYRNSFAFTFFYLSKRIFKEFLMKF
jgi:hypothetical protein